MIPYFPPPLPGELLIHRIARAASTVGHDRAKDAAEAVMGNKNWSFGVRLPNHVSALLEGVPGVAGLTVDEVLEGTLFHAVSPFLEPSAREQLLAHIMDGSGQGGTSLFPRTGEAVIFLMHCPVCTRQDREQGRRTCFRVEHQHPGSTACADHGCLLIPSRARCEQPLLPLAANWLDPDEPDPVPASELEVGIAADLRWLLQQKSTFLPGQRALSSALLVALVRSGNYAWRSGVSAPKIQEHILSKWGDAVVARVDAPIAVRKMEVERMLRGKNASSFHRYSIVARLVGMTLADLFAFAATSPEPPKAHVAQKRNIRPTTLASAKAKVEDLLAKDPGFDRLTLRREWHSTYVILLAGAPTWLAAKLPVVAERAHGGELVDWNARDEEWRDQVILGHQRLLAAMPPGAPQRIERRALLRASGLEGSRRKWGWDRLPKTVQTLGSLCDDDLAFARKRLDYAIVAARREDRVLTFPQFKFFAGVNKLTNVPAIRTMTEQAWARYSGEGYTTSVDFASTQALGLGDEEHESAPSLAVPPRCGG